MKLDFSGCRVIIDDGIVGLERIPTLEELELDHTSITSVTLLSSCKALNDGLVGLDRIPTLEDDGIAGLERSRP